MYENVFIIFAVLLIPTAFYFLFTEIKFYQKKHNDIFNLYEESSEKIFNLEQKLNSAKQLIDVLEDENAAFRFQLDQLKETMKAPPSVVEFIPPEKSGIKVPKFLSRTAVKKVTRSRDFTEKQKQRIKEQYAIFVEQELSLVSLVDLLNKEFGRSKTYNSYQKIWNS